MTSILLNLCLTRCLFKNFFGFKMNTFKSLQENHDVFNKLVLYLACCNKKYDDEDLAMTLLNSLP